MAATIGKLLHDSLLTVKSVKAKRSRLWAYDISPLKRSLNTILSPARDSSLVATLWCRISSWRCSGREQSLTRCFTSRQITPITSLILMHVADSKTSREYQSPPEMVSSQRGKIEKHQIIFRWIEGHRYPVTMRAAAQTDQTPQHSSSIVRHRYGETMLEMHEERNYDGNNKPVYDLSRLPHLSVKRYENTNEDRRAQGRVTKECWVVERVPVFCNRLEETDDKRACALDY